MRRRLPAIASGVALALLALLAVSPAGAQRAPRRAEPGMDVRLATRAGLERRGTVARRTTDSVWVRECLTCAPAPYALADLDRFDWWHARGSLTSTLGGAVAGIAIGAAFGALLGHRSDRGCHGEGLCGFGTGFGAAVGGVAGFFPGTFVGMSRGLHGRWEPLERAR